MTPSESTPAQVARSRHRGRSRHVAAGKLAPTVAEDAGLQGRLVASTPRTDPADNLQALSSWVGDHPAGHCKSNLECPVLVITTDDQFFSRELLKSTTIARFASRRGTGCGLVGRVVAQHGPEDVEAPASQGEHGLGAGLAFGAVAVLVGTRGGVDVTVRSRAAFPCCVEHFIDPAHRRVTALRDCRSTRCARGAAYCGR